MISILHIPFHHNSKVREGFRVEKWNYLDFAVLYAVSLTTSVNILLIFASDYQKYKKSIFIVKPKNNSTKNHINSFCKNAKKI